MAALDSAEAEKEAVNRQMQEVDRQIAQAMIVRPTAAQVQEAWGSIGRVWPVLSEAERTDLLANVVVSVEMKESVTLELLPQSHSLNSYSNRFGLKSRLGAGSPTTTTFNPRCHDLPLFIPAGGRNRTKVPRPEQWTSGP